MATSRFGRLTVVGAIAAMALTGACSSDSSDSSNPKIGTLLKNSEGAPDLKDSVFKCLDDYGDATKISSEGVKMLKDNDSDLTEMDEADLKIVAGAMGECVSSEDFAEAIAEGATMVRVGSLLFGPRPPKSESHA